MEDAPVSALLLDQHHELTALDGIRFRSAIAKEPMTHPLWLAVEGLAEDGVATRTQA